MHTPSPLKIGISACLLHPDSTRNAYGSKTLQYVEQSTAQWVMSGGALPVMIPSLTAAFDDYAHWLDGLVLHGGADVWPGNYGEAPLHTDWTGDRVRDDYEKALVAAFVAAGKPVFGVCRGLQLINVAFGGTLYQDIATQQPQALKHQDYSAFELNFHDVAIVPHTRLAHLLKDARSVKINSIHHQGIKDLAPGFAVEARCPDDGMIEAIRYTSGHTGGAYIAAVQWHPEFHAAELGTLEDGPVLMDFLEAARLARKTMNPA
jgi:putative glutamine amidotransferase